MKCELLRRRKTEERAMSWKEINVVGVEKQSFFMLLFYYSNGRAHMFDICAS